MGGSLFGATPGATSSGPSSLFAGTPAAKKAKKPGGGIGGLLHNVKSDFVQGVEGLGPGLAQLGEAIAYDTGQTLDPRHLLHPSKKSKLLPLGKAVGKGFQEDVQHPGRHPLNLALDLLSLASLGAGSAARAGVIGRTAGREMVLRSPAAAVGDAGGAVTRRLVSPKTLRGYGQLATAKALGKLPYETPGIGEGARYGRAAGREARRTAVTKRAHVDQFARAVGKLRPRERIATYLLATLPHPRSLEAYKQLLLETDHPAAHKALRILNDAKTNELYLQPNARMLRAHAEIARLGEQHKLVLGDLLDEVQAAERPYLHMRLAHGTRYVEPTGLVGGPSVEQLAQELERAGRPQPLYLPDTSELGKNAGPRLSGGGGRGLQRIVGSARQNKGTLFLTGQLVQEPAVLGQGYLRAVKYAHYTDVHNRLLASAVPIAKGSAIPDGWEAVRQPVRPLVAATIAGKEQVIGRTPQQFRYAQRTLGNFDDWAQQHLKYLDSPGALEQGLTTKVSEQALTDVQGRILVVPRNVARGVAGEFTRTSTLVHYMNRYPLRVWRALVLNLRPAWLVNNVLGNTLMYVVHNGDARGVQTLASAFRRLVPARSQREFDALMQRHFATQLHGTFIGTQLPDTGKLGKVLKVAGLGLANVDRRYEQLLREAAVDRVLRKHPLVRERVQAMRDETHSFHAAASQALDQDPRLARVVEDQVNAALGDFSNLTPFEQNYVRSVFPFYAWYRAISGVTLKLPLEAPIRFGLMLKLGQVGGPIGFEQIGLDPSEYPDWARSLVPRGPVGATGRFPALSTRGTNPYTTTVDLARAAGALVTGRPGEIGKALPGVNPLLAGLVSSASGKDLRTGADVSGIPGGLLGNLAASTVEGLPQFTLAQAIAGRQYRGTPSKPRLYDQNLRDLLLRYGGVPYAQVSPQRLKQMR